MYRNATFLEHKRGPIWVVCNNCLRQTEHAVLCSIEADIPDEYGPSVSEQNQVIQCKGCKCVSFRSDWQTDTDHEEDGSISRHEELFPYRLEGRKRLADCWHLPPKVNEIYMQTHKALCSNLSILAGIGIRSLVEAVCAEKNAGRGTLESKIDSLEKLGVLTPDGAKILHRLRLFGNEAVHEVTPPSEETLSAAMDVAEHLLQSVWLIPRKAQVLPQQKEDK